MTIPKRHRALSAGALQSPSNELVRVVREQVAAALICCWSCKGAGSLVTRDGYGLPCLWCNDEQRFRERLAKGRAEVVARVLADILGGS